MFSPTLTPLLDHSQRQITFGLETWQKPGSNRFPGESVTVEVCINHLLTWAPSHLVCRLLMCLCRSSGQQPLLVVWRSTAVRRLLATRDTYNSLSKLQLSKGVPRKSWCKLRKNSIFLSWMADSTVIDSLTSNISSFCHPNSMSVNADLICVMVKCMHTGPLHSGISQRILSMDAIPITNLMKNA